MSLLPTAFPGTPVAPVTKICILFLLHQEACFLVLCSGHQTMKLGTQATDAMTALRAALTPDELPMP